MQDSEHKSLGSGVTLDDLLPVAWRRIDPGGSQYLSSIQVANHDILQTILSLDEHHPELDEEPHEVAVELQRLEFKINLVLDLLGQVLTKQLDLPPRVPVRMAADQIEWQTVTPPPPGARVLVEVYLASHYPRALVLPGVGQPGAQPDWGLVRFEALGDTVQNNLEKLIFRSHRRRVALTRRAQRSP